MDSADFSADICLCAALRTGSGCAWAKVASRSARGRRCIELQGARIRSRQHCCRCAADALPRIPTTRQRIARERDSHDAYHRNRRAIGRNDVERRMLSRLPALTRRSATYASDGGRTVRDMWRRLRRQVSQGARWRLWRLVRPSWRSPGAHRRLSRRRCVRLRLRRSVLGRVGQRSARLRRPVRRLRQLDRPPALRRPDSRQLAESVGTAPLRQARARPQTRRVRRDRLRCGRM